MEAIPVGEHSVVVEPLGEGKVVDTLGLGEGGVKGGLKLGSP